MSYRKNWRLLIGLIGLVFALSPARGWAQGYYDVPPADPVVPLPLFHDRPENGGFFTGAEFWFMSQTRPISSQPIAIRGILDSDGSLSPNGQPGQIVGSGTLALSANDLGRSTFQPGYSIFAGWRGQSGVTFTASYLFLFDAKYTGGVTGVPAGFQGPSSLADTRLSSPVFNFPPQYAGPDAESDIDTTVNLQNSYGVWNAAEDMRIFFTQRYTQVDLLTRIPMFETEYSRVYGIAGGRFSWFWERFKWNTADYGFDTIPGGFDVQPVFLRDANGNVVLVTTTTTTTDANGNQVITETQAPVQIGVRRIPLADSATTSNQVAIYTNIVSNRLYGPVLGTGYECYLGHGFAFTWDIMGSAMLDVVKTRAKYELPDGSTQSKTARTEYTVVPHLATNLNLWWYPIEGVQIRVGYNALAFFNTLSAKDPIDFNFGSLDPPYERQFRLLNGINVGIGLIF